MEREERIRIRLESICMENPGVKYPGFSTIFGEDEEASPHFFCGFGTVEESSGALRNGDFVVACGFISGAAGETISVCVNAACPVKRRDKRYAASACYAFCFHLLACSGVQPGEYVLIDPSEANADILAAVAEANGVRILRSRGELPSGRFYREIHAAQCCSIGVGFDDAGYQRGSRYYPEAYVSGTVRENLRNACEFIDANGLVKAHEIVQMPERIPENNGLSEKYFDPGEGTQGIYADVGTMFRSRLCPGLIELIYTGSRWNQAERLLNAIHAISQAETVRYTLIEGVGQLCISGLLPDQSGFSILSVDAETESETVILHCDGSTFCYDGKSMLCYENGNEGAQTVALVGDKS